MDNLTHSCVGVLLSRAGFNRLAPQAGWLILAAANAPDLDIVTGARSPVLYLDCHRVWTHSWVGLPAVALAVALAWRVFFKQTVLWKAWIAAAAGVASHLLLDWMNVYGIRLTWPFTAEWHRLDWIYIVDLWVWVLFAFALAAPLIARLVNSEIGARSGPGHAGARVALVLLLLYLGGRGYLHQRAIDTLQSNLYAQGPPVRYSAFPTPVNPLRWRGWVEFDNSYVVHELNLAGPFDPDNGRVLYKNPKSSAVEAALQSESIAGLLRFNQMPYWRITPAPGGDGAVDVKLYDLRFGVPEEERFVATARLDAAGRVIEHRFAFGSLQSTAQ